MRKRGSLALSTNAIVVLIIAITILGLALAFTRNVFEDLFGEVDRITDRTTLENPPSYDDPMTLSTTKAKMRLGKETELIAAIYNKYPDPMTATLSVTDCTGANGVSTISEFTIIHPNPRTVEVGSDDGYLVSIKSNITGGLGTSICTFHFQLDGGGNTYDLYEDLFVIVE